jgi:hypothetical protein
MAANASVVVVIIEEYNVNDQRPENQSRMKAKKTHIIAELVIFSLKP